MSFCEKHTFEDRKRQSQRLKCKYPTRIPVIVQPLPNSSVKQIRQSRFLVPHDSSAGMFEVCLRKHIIGQGAEFALYYFVDISKKEFTHISENKMFILIPPVELMGTLYKQFEKPDGFLYLYYDEEHTFG